MKHSSTRDLYGYWNKQRGTHFAPARADIDPTAIPRVLADTFLLGIGEGGDFIFRLAGTRVCALFCRELKGEDFVALFDPAGRDKVGELLDIVCYEPAASVGSLTALSNDGAAAELELLLLPLRHRGCTDSRVLGVLAPVGSPYWLGATPVAALSLGMLRHIALTDAPAASPTPFPGGRPRHGLVIYDGGRR